MEYQLSESTLVIYALAPVVVPLLMLAAQLASTSYNNYQQNKANQENIAFQQRTNELNSRMTYENNMLARKWAVEDWNKTNQYNHPLQQMARLREAGLNPNMVYGNGAQTTAQMINRTQPQTANAVSPRTTPLTMPDLSGSLSEIYNVRESEARIQNMQQQNKLLEQQGNKNDLMMAGMITKNAKSDFDLAQAKRLQDVAVESAIAKNELTKAQTGKVNTETELMPQKFDLQQQEFRLKQAKTQAEITNINADIARKVYETSNILPAQKQKLLQEISNMEKTGALKEWDVRLRTAGLNPSDPSYVRIIVAMAYKLADHFGINLGSVPIGVFDAIPTGPRQPNQIK